MKLWIFTLFALTITSNFSWCNNPPCDLGDFQLSCGSLPGQPNCVLCDDDATPGEVVGINALPSLDLCYVIQSFDSSLGVRTDTFCDPGQLQYFVSEFGWILLTQVYDGNTGCQDFTNLGDTVFVSVVNPPQLEFIADITVCEFYVLPDITGQNLSGSQAYFLEPNGVGASFIAGDTIFSSTTLYAFDEINGCDDEEAFVATILPGSIPSFEFDDFCENVSGFPSNATPTGGIYEFAPDLGDGSSIDPVSGEFINADGGTTYSIQYTVNGACGGSDTVQVFVNPVPFYTIQVSACDTNDTWLVGFTTNADSITTDVGIVINNGGGSFNVYGIPIPMVVNINFLITNTGCEVSLQLSPPLPCPCPDIPEPTPGDTAYLCEGSPPPIISASAASDLVIDWYDAPSGGTLLQSASSTYQTLSAGIFYAEARNPVTDCVSDRVAVVVIFFPNFPISISNDTCLADGSFAFLVNFEPGGEGDSLVASEGVVTNNNDGTFLVDSVPSGSSVMLDVFYEPSGCTWSYTVTAASCDCAGLLPPISLGDTSVCDDGQPFPLLEVIVSSGFLGHWYTQPSGGVIINTGSSFVPPDAGTYYVATYDPISDCESSDRVAITLTLLPIPTYEFTSDSCDATTQLYSFVFMTDADNVLPSQGTLTDLGGSMYQVSDLNVGANFSLFLTNLQGCSLTITFVIPNCGCPNLDAPISGGDQFFCEGSAIPAISASVPGGNTIDWYDTLTGGIPVASDVSSFVPPGPGTYYAETRDLVSGCTSGSRTPVTITVLNRPLIAIDSIVCDLTLLYDIYLSTDAVSVVADQGTALNISGESFVIQGCTAGFPTLISVESADGCVTDSLIQSPTCACPSVDSPISLGDTNICEGAAIPGLAVASQPGFQVNWYDAAFDGNLLLENSTLFIPPGLGTYFAENEDLITGCISTLRTSVTLGVLPLSNVLVDSIICDQINELYAVTLTTDALAVSISVGVLDDLGGGLYRVINIPSDEFLTLIFVSTDGCTSDTTLIGPDCDCPTLNPPIVSPDTAYCIGEDPPSLTASADFGFIINWYDAMLGGNLLLAGSNDFDPSGPGVFYAEAIDTTTMCVSGRSAVTLELWSSPGFVLDSVVCDNQNSYSVYFQTDAVAISFTQGELDTLSTNQYRLFEQTSNVAASISMFSINQCVLDMLIAGIDCDCPVIEAPTAGGDTTYCEGSMIPAIRASVDDGFIINWFDSAVGGINLAEGELLMPNVSGTYYAESVDTASGCRSSERTAVTIAESPLPTIIIDSLVCREDLQGYRIVFRSNADSLNQDSGSMITFDGSTYTIDSVASGLDIILSLWTESGCRLDTALTGLTCDCVVIDPPISVGDTSFCAGSDPVPILGVIRQAGIQYDWYDAPSSGNLLASDTALFQPTETQIIVYVEATDRTTGCISDIRTPIRLTFLPSPVIVLDSIQCIDSIRYQVYFTTEGFPMVSHGNLTNLSMNSYSIDNIDSANEVLITIESIEGCLLDTTIVPPDCECPFIAAPVVSQDTTICFGTALPALSAIAGDEFIINWYPDSTGGVALLENSRVFMPSAGGIYYAEAVDSVLGCRSGIRSAVAINILPEIILNVDTAQTTCFLSGGLEASSSAPRISWKALDGGTISDSIGSFIEFVLPQTGNFRYVVTATNLSCEIRDTVLLRAEEFLIEANILDVSCIDSLTQIEFYGENDNGPYLYRENESVLLTFENLPYTIRRPEGNYSISIENTSGCVDSVAIAIPEYQGPLLDLGADIVGVRGQFVSRPIQTNLIPDEFIWNSTNGLFNFNTLNPNIEIIDDFLYVLTITDSLGCQAEDSLYVKKLNSNDVFIPSAFSPNNDGVNDEFVLFAPDNPLVEYISIFNRWGGKVYERSNLPLDELDPWNGLHNGKELLSGAYIYVARMTWPDGKSQIYQGDITLLR
jgi:gliding motility-associated-like protein